MVTLTEEVMPGNITRVILTGKIDLMGAQSIDLRMNTIAGSQKAVLIDLRGVSFLGSMGLRSLLAPARTIKSKGGKVVFFAPIDYVDHVLKISGADHVAPVIYDLQKAVAALQ